MPHGLFVTGTGTGVGKTVACATLMRLFRDQADLRYWKPIQTGIESDDDTAYVAATGARVHLQGVRLPRPLSPHLSAKLAGVHVDVAQLADMFQPANESWIVEGAGGVLVPLNDAELMIDLMARLALPVLVVASSGLGTINHTLLTLEALRKRDLKIAGVVLSGEPNPENEAAIAQHGKVPVASIQPEFGGYVACPRNRAWLEYLR